MFQLKKIKDRIYLLTFDDQYDLCMHFLRYQEFYESPKFKGRNFEIIDYMNWYHRKYSDDKTFTYANDWSGFNIPGKIIFELNPIVKDPNRYDRFMLSIAEYIGSKAEDFYLIGAHTNDLDVIDHELAHGMYYTDDKYHEDMNDLLFKLPVESRRNLYTILEKIGYDTYVLYDEAQAFLATGLVDKLDTEEFQKLTPAFEELFKQYKLSEVQ